MVHNMPRPGPEPWGHVGRYPQSKPKLSQSSDHNTINCKLRMPRSSEHCYVVDTPRGSTKTSIILLGRATVGPHPAVGGRQHDHAEQVNLGCCPRRFAASASDSHRPTACLLSVRTCEYASANTLCQIRTCHSPFWGSRLTNADCTLRTG